jgi:mRNA turnover protein 4
LGKNKIMAVALGRDEDDEYSENLHRVGNDLKGNVGLLLTNKSKKEVKKYFDNYKCDDYARSGSEAPFTFEIKAGKIDQPGSMVEQLRKLGLPVKLDMAEIYVEQDYTVCEEGSVLTPEQAKLLQHFGKKTSAFQVTLLSWWSKGSYATM